MTVTPDTPKEAKKVKIQLDINFNNVISYYMLLSATTPINRLYVKNMTDENIENVTVSISSTPAFLLPRTIEQQFLPRKSTLSFDSGNYLSPVYMVSLDERIEGEVVVEVMADGELLAEARNRVTVLAFNECDYGKQTESLVSFVRRTAETNAFAPLIEKKLEAWKVKPKRIYGEAGKNDVRFYFAAAYAVLVENNFIKGSEAGSDIILSSHADNLKKKIITETELTLFAAAILESAGINCVFGKSGGAWYLGAFLTEECFPDTVIDDASLLENKLEKGVNDISLVAVGGIFDGMTFESNEQRAAANIKKQGIEFFADVKYARMMNVRSLPQRIKTPSGYDVVDSGDYRTGDASQPKKLPEYKGRLAGSARLTKAKQWERRLLDLDMRNTLLNFRTSSYTVKILTARLEDFIVNLPKLDSYEIKAAAGEESVTAAFDEPFEKTVDLKPVSDFILYEYKNKHLRTKLEKKDLDHALLSVYRKERTRREESGSASLYLAAGFLKWCEKGGSDFKYAPILLYPVNLNRKGTTSPAYSVTVNEDEVHINTTLLEYLYQQFGIDMRGLSEITGNDQDFLPILLRFRREISVMKGWAVYDSVYLCSLSFSSYLMWKDVRAKMDKFKENRLIGSLISGENAYAGAELVSAVHSSDEAYNAKNRIYLPISADSSQYAAIVDSLAKSFVLHGPPGTGKSQTITNIVANNIVRGRRVLFVAEKMAALSVVYKRLNDIGIGDFCLELYSEKTKKTDVVDKIVSTLGLAGSETLKNYDESRNELSQHIETLQGEMNAVHRRHPIGFSIYEGVIGYFEHKNAPDCLSIDSLFYEKLNKETFNKSLRMLSELAARAAECGSIERSPLKDIGAFAYDDAWRVKGESILNIYLKEIKALRSYARSLVPVFNMRTVSFSPEKLEGLYTVAKLIREEETIRVFFSNKSSRESIGIAEKYLALIEVDKKLAERFELNYRTVPKNFDTGYIIESGASERSRQKAAKRYASHARYALEKENREAYFDGLRKIAANRAEIDKCAQKLNKLLGIPANDTAALILVSTLIQRLLTAAKTLYAEFDVRVFYECCKAVVDNHPLLYLEFFMSAYESSQRAGRLFREIFAVAGGRKPLEINAEIEYVGTLIKNMDLIPGWCKYQEIVQACRRDGFEFVLEPLAAGEIDPDDILSCFKKCVYDNFVRNEISLDPGLCRFSGAALEELIDRFRQLSDEFERLTRAELYQRLVLNVPKPEDEGEHSLEKVYLMRAQKNSMKGTTLRSLFTHIPNILKATCPCMLMSPASVTQFLDIDMDKFDLVVFDEASQVPTCKAVGTIARAKEVIVVGDPKQLPPTSFFGADFKSEDFPELEDLDSILDDCLTVGMPERHLLWHYRSHHESLIAFSNAMYYQNTLLTFPSPAEMNSKVTLCYSDGVYERGGSKRNKKEAQELVKDIVARLKNPFLKNQSIGVVTFNTAQQTYIEDVLTKALRDNDLEIEAYERDEPVFVKNLENVQGDERDVILFSVGYGPDREGRLSLNFGPLNQAGGFRRLNVAVTRARMEMKVFSSIKSNMIDLSRTGSLGVRGLKAFLEYAERGRDMLVFDAKNIQTPEKGLGEQIAAELKKSGMDCVYDLGVSDFKIDVAVVDPRDRGRYILAVIVDSANEYKIKSVRDRVAMQTKILKTLGWNVYYLWTVNYMQNPKRETAKLKEAVAELIAVKTAPKKNVRESLTRFKKPYRPAGFKPLAKAGPDFVLNDQNADAIRQKLLAVVKAEGPIDDQLLLERAAEIYSVQKANKKAAQRLADYADALDGYKKTIGGVTYFLDRDCETFRPLDDRTKRDFLRVYPYEIVAAARCALETKATMNADELTREIMSLMNVPRRTKPVQDKIDASVSLGVKDGFIIQTVDGLYKS
jgi:hypothetical protein